MVWNSFDALTEILARDGVHEESVLLLSKFILQGGPEDQVILDIGANIGSYAIPLARDPVLQDRVSVYCFEVQRHVYMQLCGNIFLNGLERVYPFNFAIGATNGTIGIPKIDPASCWNVGGYSIDPVALRADRTDFPQASIIGTEPAEIRRIDDLPGIPESHLVKLDVEGHELEVLQGMLGHLARSGFPPILFELWQFDWYAAKRALLLEFLAQIGYTDISEDLGHSNHLAQHPRSRSPRVHMERVGNTIQLRK
jgi:FkbM family methyltransferase